MVFGVMGNSLSCAVRSLPPAEDAKAAAFRRRETSHDFSLGRALDRVGIGSLSGSPMRWCLCLLLESISAAAPFPKGAVGGERSLPSTGTPSTGTPSTGMLHRIGKPFQMGRPVPVNSPVPVNENGLRPFSSRCCPTAPLRHPPDDCGSRCSRRVPKHPDRAAASSRGAADCLHSVR